MARREALLPGVVTLIAGIALSSVAGNAAKGSQASKTQQTSVRGAATANRVAVRASGDEATAPRKSANGAAVKSSTVRHTRAVGESTDFVDNGRSK